LEYEHSKNVKIYDDTEYTLI